MRELCLRTLADRGFLFHAVGVSLGNLELQNIPKPMTDPWLPGIFTYMDG